MLSHIGTVSSLFCIYIVLVKAKETYYFTNSGKRIEVSRFQKYLPEVDSSSLNDLVFERDVAKNELVSKSLKIKLPPSSMKFTSYSQSNPFYYDNTRSYRYNTLRTNQFPVLSKTSTGHTFLFDQKNKNTLIAAWGPLLSLFSIRAGNEVVYFNAIPFDDNMRKTFSELNYVKPTSKTNCKQSHDLYLEIRYDALFCDLFDRDFRRANYYMIGLMSSINELYSEVCINVKLYIINGHCSTYYDSPYYYDQFGTCSQHFAIEHSLQIRNNINYTLLKENCHHSTEDIFEEMRRTRSQIAVHDTIFVTGILDKKTLAGATFRGQACQRRLHFAWVERANPVVVAHEIGHLVGSRHTATGIMKSSVKLDQAMSLSNESKVLMANFLKSDLKSWCITRQKISKKHPTKKFADLNFKHGIKGGLIDTTMASITFDSKKNDMIVLGYDDEPQVRMKVLYSIIPDLFCKHEKTDLRCNEGSGANSLRLQRFDTGLQFVRTKEELDGVAFGNIRNSLSKDIVIGSVQFVTNNSLRYETQIYRVGCGVGKDGSPPVKWSEEKKVPKYFQRSPYADFHSSMSIGNVRSKQNNDLIYVNHYNDLNGRRVFYLIGFDLQENGDVRGGWSGNIEVPGFYGKPTQLTATIIDLDGNGKPEIVICHFQENFDQEIGFFRVGKDLNRTGHVTGGWTKFISPPFAPDLFENDLGTALSFDVSFDILNNQPVFAVPFYKGTGYPPNINFGSGYFDKTYMNQAAELIPNQGNAFGCSLCYNGYEVSQCEKNVTKCNSAFDKVEVLHGTGIKNLSPIMSRHLDHDRITEKTNLKILSNKYEKLDDLSFYCIGFKYFAESDQVCEAVDLTTVLSKGMEKLFLQEIFLEDIDMEDIESTTLFEDPIGAINGKPIAVRVRISRRKANYKEAIIIAMNRVKQRKGFEKFFGSSQNNKPLPSKDGRFWIITYYLKNDIQTF